MATRKNTAKTYTMGELAGPGDEAKTSTADTAANTGASTSEAKSTETVLGFEGLTATPSSGIQVQPRTLSIPKPATFYFEPLSPKRKDHGKGNDHNQITSGVHQVDPNRQVSCAPIMPNIALARDTGNYYPKDEVAAGEGMSTSKTWAPFVRASHVLCQVLKTAKAPMTGDEILAAVTKKVSVGKNADGTPKGNLIKAVRDTLRDMRCYGAVQSSGAQKNWKKVSWGFVDPASIKMAARRS